MLLALCQWALPLKSVCKSNRPPPEYIAANAEKIRELGLKTSTVRFHSEWRRAEFEVQCHGQTAQTSGAGAQGRRSRQSDRDATGEPWRFFY